MITPKNGYAFRHKESGNVALAIYLGEWDSIENYEEISEEEYQKILHEQEKIIKSYETEEYDAT